MSAKLLSTFAESATDPVNLGFLGPEPLLSYIHKAEWTPFQTHYFPEKLVAPGIEPGTSGSVASNSDQ
jgi:hypothetical protein